MSLSKYCVLLMSKLLEISQLGSPVLREKARFVKNIDDKSIQDLINDLIFTVKKADGVGIAAPQVYESKRLFVLASEPNARYKKAPKIKPTAIINPEILAVSEEMERGWEGCLSIPGIRAIVPRHLSIKVKYTTRDGKKKVDIFDEFLARVFQHEFDHLNGIVYLDRIESTKDIITEKEFDKLMKNNS